MKKRNLPIAIIYCVLNFIAIINLFFIIFFTFKHGNSLKIISAFFIGISMFFYTLFNCLFHWITHNTESLKSLNKISLITDITLIFSFLMYYSFSFMNGPLKWVFFGMNCLFFAVYFFLFFIWTNIPFFIAEILKDTMFLPFIIFSFAIIPSVCKNVITLIIFITIVLLLILSIIFKYVFAGTRKVSFYNVSQILKICSILLNISIFYIFLFN